MSFANRVAIVTGAGQGIGRAIAEDLARRGATVAALDVDVAKAEETAAALADSGAFALGCDIADREAAQGAIESVAERAGRVDILVNAAGIGGAGPLSGLTEKRVDRHFGVNLTGQLWMAQAAAPHMERAGWGRIVNVASIAGVMGGTNRTLYTASKTGLVGLTKALACELGPLGITVNCVCPGPADTPAWETFFKRFPEQAEQTIARNPMRRLATPQDIANAVAFFASDGAAYVNGAVLSVDGGVSRLP